MQKNTLSWDAFSNLPLENRIAFFKSKKERPSILLSEQFSREELDKIYILTNKIRLIAKTNEGQRWLLQLLPNIRAMLYFVQPSTRTFLSFTSALETLGVRTANVRSITTSSEIKGESFPDTIRTFSSYFDLVIIRHPNVGFAERAAYVLHSSQRPIPLINAGSSKDDHPTQALLDIFTLRRSFSKIGGLENKTIMMVGDLARGRTVRSLCKLLTLFPKMKIILSSPKGYEMKTDIKQYLDEKKVEFIETNSMEEHLGNIDAIYMTRIQDEWNQSHEKKRSPRSFFKVQTKGQSLKGLKAQCNHHAPTP